MKIGFDHRAFFRGIARWLPAPIIGALRPLWLHIDLLFVDHGIFRIFYANRHRVSDKMWRSSQPSPRHVRWLARQGVRTIINLRGPRDSGSYELEIDACERAGITLVDFVARSRDAPEYAMLHEAREIFRTIEYPALMHCKSGADRVGFVSALYLFVHEGRPLEEAVKQLHWRYGHIRHAKTGLLDYFFECYARDNAQTPMEFYEWVDTVYDRDAMKAEFKASGISSFIVDWVLRRE